MTLEIKSLTELLEESNAEHRRNRRHESGYLIDACWNGWRLGLTHYVLDLPHCYEIDLERCTSSAETLDWIMQIDGKHWREQDMTKVVAGLIRALNDVLNPQATLCSFGGDKRLTRAQVRDRVNELAKYWPQSQADLFSQETT